jgi:hypothetical protein
LPIPNGELNFKDELIMAENYLLMKRWKKNPRKYNLKDFEFLFNQKYNEVGNNALSEFSFRKSSSNVSKGMNNFY